MIKMSRIVRLSIIHAVIFLSAVLILPATAEDGTKTRPMTTKANPKTMPFLQSEAENWSFQNQIKKRLPEYLKTVEANAKQLMRTRYKFGRAVKISEYYTEIASKTPDSKRPNKTVHFVDGWASGMANISLAGESSVMYEEPALKFRCDVNFWKNLMLAYRYNIMEGTRESNGEIKADIKDARYVLTFVFDLLTQTMNLTDFKKKNFGSRDVRMDEGTESSRLSGILTPVFSAFYRDTVLPDVETAMHTILEDSFKNVSVSTLLPKVDYKNERPAPLVDVEGLDICDTDAETDDDEDGLPWKSVKELPFIVNVGEMWAFQKQMDKGLNQLMENISIGLTDHLAERNLLRAKLSDDKFLMNIRDQTSTTRHGPMSLSGGWFSSPFKFSVSRVRQVEFSDGVMMFAATFHLEDSIEFVHDFKAEFLREEYEGKAKGKVTFMEYTLNFSLDLEMAQLTLEDPKLDCLREIFFEVTGQISKGEWFSSELKRNILKRFQDSTVLQIHTVLSQAFHYAASAATAEKYLPKWNYARNFRTDFDLRIGEHDEDSVEICDAERIRKSERRILRFSKLITKDGVFNDLTPNADGKYFTHVSGVKNNAIRFTSTNTQSRYFDRELRLKMNEYMYNLLKTTAKIIRIRGLGRAKMPEYEGADYDKDIRIGKCWIEGLTSVAVTGVDLMEYDQNVITLITNLQVYKDLKFEGVYTTTGARENRGKGKIITQLPPMELSLRIDIDYLGEKTAKLDYMKLECVGANASYISPQSVSDHVSEAMDHFFRHVLVENLHQIFRHAFEDAMMDTKWELYLPGWDYERDYITEIILHQNENRFQIDMDVCNGTEVSKPSLKEFYADVETVDFSLFLPEIKIAGLRSSFERQINILMDDAVGSMWENMANGPLKRFDPPIFSEKGVLLEPKEGHRTSMIYNVIDFQGLTSGTLLDEVDFAYGKEDTLIILYQQSWDAFKFTYNVSLADEPNGEREFVTAVATAEDLKYLLKVRFFLGNSSLSVDEFFLRCVRNLSVTVKGLRPEREWMLESVKKEIISSLPASELVEIKELLYILYGYAAAELNSTLYTYAWTYDRELFNIAAAPEERHRWEEPRPCTGKTKHTGENVTVIARGNVPFIGSEVEWWSFSMQTRSHVDRFMKDVKRLAREFIRDHASKNRGFPTSK
ncbi:uncharacterized protein [Hetaerina americana]|uniref:uncharacterized protein n=1 Tax=Hetaerina americana TaxID=62018 RepID=UPI003A7F19DF